MARGKWQSIETLSFRVLIPAVLVLAIAGSDLSMDRFGGLISAIVLTLLALTGMIFAVRAGMRAHIADPQFTSLFQSTVRWNAFVALAAVEQLVVGGLEVIAVAIAVSIPLINIICIFVLAGFGPERTNARQIASTVARNPLVQACAVGLALNLTGMTIPMPIAEALDMIGRAALGVGLMVVGAGISLRRLGRWNWQVALGAFLRPILCPVVFVLVAWIFDLNPIQTFVGVLVFSAPAATNGYVVAKQMGGDADLYADVLTWQTCLSLLVLPVWASVML